MFADSDLYLAEDEEAVSSFTLTHDNLACGRFDFFGAIPEQIEGGFIKASENRHVL
jgi:hypothetical protein